MSADAVFLWYTFFVSVPLVQFMVSRGPCTSRTVKCQLVPCTSSTVKCKLLPCTLCKCKHEENNEEYDLNLTLFMYHIDVFNFLTIVC